VRTTLLAMLLAGPAGAEAPGPALVDTTQVTRVGEVVRLPGLTIHGGEKKFIEATGRVVLTDGILEFIAVEHGGREYESVLALDCKPSALQFALLLIGCEPGAVPQRAKAGENIGDRLELELSWQLDGKTKRLPVEKLLVERKTKKPPAKLPWIFTGSHFATDPLSGREVFLADAERAFIALWWSPGIPVNLGGEYGNPYRGEDQGFEVNRKLVPPLDTPVMLMFRKSAD
jgi:hypothetical protein